MRFVWMAGLVAMFGIAAVHAAGQQRDSGQQDSGWPASALESRQDNPYDRAAAATGGSVFRLDPARDHDPALRAALLRLTLDRSPQRQRTTFDLARGSRRVGFDVASASAPLTININGLGRGRVEILRPDGSAVGAGDSTAQLRTYGPAGGIGVLMQDDAPATGRWTIAVHAPAEVTIDVEPVQALLSMDQ